MYYWKNINDVDKDAEILSVFYTPNSEKAEGQKFNYVNKKNISGFDWYKSDSSDDDDLSFGRGRKIKKNSNKNPGNVQNEPENHLELIREIRTQVRDTVGRLYSNDSIEAYYNVFKDAEQKQIAATSKASSNNLNSQSSDSSNKTVKISNKCSVAETVETNAKNFKEKNYKNNNGYYKYQKKVITSNGPRFSDLQKHGPSTSRKNVDFQSQKEFPPL